MTHRTNSIGGRIAIFTLAAVAAFGVWKCAEPEPKMKTEVPRASIEKFDHFIGRKIPAGTDFYVDSLYDSTQATCSRPGKTLEFEDGSTVVFDRLESKGVWLSISTREMDETGNPATVINTAFAERWETTDLGNGYSLRLLPENCESNEITLWVTKNKPKEAPKPKGTQITGTQTVIIGGGDQPEMKLDVPVRNVPQTKKFLPGGDLITYSELITGDRIEFEGGASIMVGEKTTDGRVRLSVTHLGLDQNLGFTTEIEPIFAKFGETTDTGIGCSVVAHMTSDGTVTLNVWKNSPNEKPKCLPLQEHGPSRCVDG